MSTFKDIAPGLLLTLCITIISFLMALLHPSFDTLAVSIIFGMLVANMLGDKETIEKGMNAALKVFLPLGIGLYGIQLSFAGSALRLWPYGAMTAGAFIFMLLVTYYISRGFGLDRELSILLCTGMSVCGASAIVVIAPLIGSRKENTSISILSVMTAGLTGMLLYRFMFDVIGLPAEDFAFIAGSTLPMFGQVEVAASAMGSKSLLLATGIKLMRVSSLAAVAAVLLFIYRRQRREFPWFMVVFFFLMLVANVSGPAGALLKGPLGHISRFSLTAALAAIGLSIDFDSVTEKGTAPLFAALLSWGIVAMAIYLALIVAA